MPTADADSRTPVRRGRLTAEILAAARRLVDEKGDSFTTQELVKEAGVALQTFYRHFEGKDRLLVAVIAEMINENCVLFEASAQDLADPLDRLHTIITGVFLGLREAGSEVGARFITTEHWRLHQLFPKEMEAATQPFADLIQRELEAAAAAGLASPRDPERDAWLINRLVISTYHHYAFLQDSPKVDTIADDVWRFCLAAVHATSPESSTDGSTS